MPNYNDCVFKTFNKVCAKNKLKGEDGASASEVFEQMGRDGTLSPTDTVIDIADILATKFGKPWQL